MEKIDLYTADKKKLNKTFIRHKDVLLDNEYYLLEQAWIINEKGEILLTKRNSNKSYGGQWEATAGHVKSGETDLEGIQREVYEELGLQLDPSDFTFIKSMIKKQAILDVWVVKKDVKIEDLNLKNDEVMDAKFVSIEEFKNMLEKKEVIDNLSYFLEIYNTL